MLRTTSIPAAIALLAALALAGCGANASHPATSHTVQTTSHASAADTTTGVAGTTTTGVSATTTTQTSKPGSLEASALAFSKCMRAHGVTNFPDPSPGGGFVYKSGSGVVSSPSFQTAQAACQRLMGGGPGSGPPPSRQTMARLLRIAECMRAHGVHQFPDPLYNRPKQFPPGKYQEITDFDGATLLFPTSMNLQAPAYRQALNACGAPPLGLHH